MEIDFGGRGVEPTAGNTVTVGALREALEQCDDDFAIYTEGCDCIGTVLSLIEDQSAGTVTLYRSHAVFNNEPTEPWVESRSAELTRDQGVAGGHVRPRPYQPGAKH